MTLDKSIRSGNDTSEFVHDYRELIVFLTRYILLRGDIIWKF